MRHSSQTILITGSSRGIGLALVSLLSARGDHVIALCRTPSSELILLNEDPKRRITLFPDLDVLDPSNLPVRLEQAGVKRLDLLINNAGVLARTPLDDLNFSHIECQIATNAIAPLKVVASCLDYLGDGSKIVNITSRMGSISDNTSGGMYGYRMSKVALNMATRSLSVDLKERGIAVACIHPGFVRTDMTGHRGLIEPEESAQGIIERITRLTLETSGQFYHCNGEELPW